MKMVNNGKTIQVQGRGESVNNQILQAIKEMHPECLVDETKNV